MRTAVIEAFTELLQGGATLEMTVALRGVLGNAAQSLVAQVVGDAAFAVDVCGWRVFELPATV
jgi:hypothetical protein